jgi:hypothetical protein
MGLGFNFLGRPGLCPGPAGGRASRPPSVWIMAAVDLAPLIKLLQERQRETYAAADIGDP